MKKLVVLLLSIVLILCGCTKEEKVKKEGLSIVTSNYPCYDFASAIVGSDNVTMLLSPGAEMHDYEPTPSDIIKIQDSDMFIYVGGESESWVDGLINNIDTSKVRIVKLMDLVTLHEEETKEGMQEEAEEEEETEYDEHIWTSPKNAVIIINKLATIIKEMDKDNSSKYNTNAQNYIEALEGIDRKLNEVIEGGVRNTIVFGDRFPLLYFVKDYNLDYYAAFKGCSESVEADAKTVAFLIDKVKKEKIPVIFKLELSNGSIADTISEETGAKTLTFNSAHNISLDDFNKGVTYVDLWSKNIEALKEALS